MESILDIAEANLKIIVRRLETVFSLEHPATDAAKLRHLIVQVNTAANLFFDYVESEFEWNELNEPILHGTKSKFTTSSGAKINVVAFSALRRVMRISTGLPESGKYFITITRTADRVGSPDVSTKMNLTPAGVDDSPSYEIHAVKGTVGNCSLVVRSDRKFVRYHTVAQTGRIDTIQYCEEIPDSNITDGNSKLALIDHSFGTHGIEYKKGWLVLRRYGPLLDSTVEYISDVGKQKTGELLNDHGYSYNQTININELGRVKNLDDEVKNRIIAQIKLNGIEDQYQVVD